MANTMTQMTRALESAGYRYHPKMRAWVRLWISNRWIRGSAYFMGDHGYIEVTAATDYHSAIMETFAEHALEVAEDEIFEIGRRGGRISNLRIRRRTKKGRKKIRDKVHKVAKKISKNRVLTALRKAQAAVLESPIGDAGVKLGSSILTAFGIPEPASRAFLNHARYSRAERARSGGRAGQVDSILSDRNILKGFASDIYDNQRKALPKTITSTLQGGFGGGMSGDLQKMLKGKVNTRDLEKLSRGELQKMFKGKLDPEVVVSLAKKNIDARKLMRQVRKVTKDRRFRSRLLKRGRALRRGLVTKQTKAKALKVLRRSLGRNYSRFVKEASTAWNINAGRRKKTRLRPPPRLAA